MQTHLFSYDLPEEVDLGLEIALDTETMGLCPHRDRLCLLQISAGDGNCYLVHFPQADFTQSPRLCKILRDPKVLKIFHFGRFDIAVLAHSFGFLLQNVFCTKIASRLARTFTARHSLKDLCRDLLGVELNKGEQTSDWGSPTLSSEQLRYAGTDVLYLHQLRDKLTDILIREDRLDIAQACFQFLPYRSKLDLMAGLEFDVFAHS